MRFWNSVVIILLLGASAFANVRGRVRIINNAVRADNGNVLRGEHLLMHRGSWSKAGNQSTYTPLRDGLKLNLVRLLIYRDTRSASSWFSIDDVIPAIDKAVNVLENMGMYVIIDYHAVPCGHYEPAAHPGDLEAFWHKVAPRYKNRTHVIYEAANEPVGGGAANYDAAAVAKQERLYQLIRGYAPSTHIILWSFDNAGTGMCAKVREAPGINYSNASVAYHPYGFSRPSILELKAEYPVIMTEFMPGWLVPDQPKPAVTGEIMFRINWHEDQGIGWVGLKSTEYLEVNWSADPAAIDGVVGIHRAAEHFSGTRGPVAGWMPDDGAAMYDAAGRPTTAGGAGPGMYFIRSGNTVLPVTVIR